MRTLITPDYAERILSKNEGNRLVNNRHLIFLTQQILDGQFIYNGATIVVDTNHNLLDGQHRLLACVKADKPIDVEFITGVNPTVMSTIDTGKIRLLPDVLDINGFKNTKLLAKMVRFIYYFELKRTYNATKSITSLTHTKGLQLAYDNPDYADHIYCDLNNNVITNSYKSIISYIFSQIDKEATVEFIKQLTVGVNLSENTPTLILRNQLIKSKLKNGTAINQINTFAMLFRAFDCFLNDNVRKQSFSGLIKNIFPYPNNYPNYKKK